MAEANWSYLTGGLDSASVARGTSSGFTQPNGGGSFLFGFNSLSSSLGAVGLYANLTNFAPFVDDGAVPTGGSVRGAVKRATSAGPTGFAPFLFACAQGLSVNDQAYMLGLSDNDPHEIVLVKGAPVAGLDPTASSVLATGSGTFAPDAWHHLRLDAIVNPNGDVVLVCYQNDLTVNAVTAPVWAAIPGISAVTDDALSITSESAPFSGGYAGFGFQTSQIQRRGFFDHIEVHRQR